MDFSSAHVPYVLSSYAFAALIFLMVACWTVRQDRKVQQQLSKLASDAA